MLFFLIYYLLVLPIIFTYDCDDQICDVLFEIKENTPIENLQWNLMELFVNRTYQYSLETTSDYFELQSNILKYRLDDFDREKLCPTIDLCRLQLQIFTQTSLIILFQLLILDENDWKPIFHQTYLPLLIRENLPNNYQIQLPIAYDYDSDEYNIDRYEFVNPTDEIMQKFQLEKSFDELRLNIVEKFDCEKKNNYQFDIHAIDKGGLISNILHVNITVGDINEYQPRFTQRLYHAHIHENEFVRNRTILRIHANDDDCDDRILHYSILNTEISNDRFPFEIDRYTGEIQMKFSVDYESISIYRFRVQASNLDEITSSIVPIIIDIIDVNDHSPMIYMNIFNEYKLSNEFMINISENLRIQQVIGTILIRDDDSTIINRRLTLQIRSCLPLTSSCPIELDSRMNENSIDRHPRTYLIRTARVLDRESNDETFTVVFEARDYGQPSLTSEYHLIVNIHDENDCMPIFLQSNYQFRVSNSSKSGFFIGHIQAIDEDYSPEFRLIQYRLVKDEFIRIDPHNGHLFLVKQPLVNSTLNLTVIAFDQQNQSLFNQANINIIFHDESICLPRFNRSIYVFNTTEHQSIPYKIGQVYFNNCSFSSSPMIYSSIQANSSSFPFFIDSTTGIITVIRELDREIRSFYRFDLYLLNSESKTEIQIIILDINDHRPIFNTSQEHFIYISLNVSEDQPIFIANIFTTDADSGNNGRVSYFFRNRDLYAYFHLYSNGSIILYNSISIYLPIRLEIYARDHGYPKELKSRETLVIYICDQLKRNECSPSILRRNIYLGSILIMISIASFLLVIIVCICWNLYLKNQLKRNGNNPTFSCRIEPRNNLIISDSIYDTSPTMIRINSRYQHPMLEKSII